MQCKECQAAGVNVDARFCSTCGRSMGSYYAASAAADAAFTRFSRPRAGRMIGGVCAALSRHYGWDVTLVRLAAVLLAVVSCGWTLIAYLAAWIIMPVDAEWTVPAGVVIPPPGGGTGAAV